MSEGLRALERAVTAWNESDRNQYLELYADDVVLHSGSMGESHGVREVKAKYRMVWSAYDSRLEVDELFSEGNSVACRYRWIATEKVSGKAFSVQGMTILHFAGEKCVERWDLEFKAES